MNNDRLSVKDNAIILHNDEIRPWLLELVLSGEG